jgi:hypothetical protein
MSKRFVLLFLISGGLAAAFCRAPSSNAGKQKIGLPLHIQRAVATFSTVNSPEVRELIDGREGAIQAATTVLGANAQGQNIDEDAVVRAAELLAEMRADDPEAIAAIIANLDFSPSIVIVTEVGPLGGRPAAQALSRIGGRRVTDALTNSLRAPKSKKYQLIIANILVACEPPEIAANRLELALKNEQAQKNADKDHLRQLEAVKHWLDNPELLHSAKHWPCHM